MRWGPSTNKVTQYKPDKPELYFVYDTEECTNAVVKYNNAKYLVEFVLGTKIEQILEYFYMKNINIIDWQQLSFAMSMRIVENKIEQDVRFTKEEIITKYPEYFI